MLTFRRATKILKIDKEIVSLQLCSKTHKECIYYYTCQPCQQRHNKIP